MAEAVLTSAPAQAGIRTAWVIVAVCTVINMVDGFDILAMAFTAPTVAREWGLEPTALGLVLSASFMGLAAGSLFLSPLADVVGRRKVLLSCLCVIGASMIPSALAAGPAQLSAFRFFTGLGIGGMIPVFNTIIGEYAPEHRRGLAIGLVTGGIPLGGTLGGLAAIALIENFGWPAVFLFGGCFSLALVPVVWLTLPESLSFLIARQPRSALVRANVVLRRLDRPPLAALPPRAARHGAGLGSVFDIFGATLLGGTFLVCAAFFLNSITFYFVVSWTPKMVVDMGLPNETGIAANVMITLFGTVGGLFCGYFAGRLGPARVTAGFMAIAFAAMVGLSLMPPVATPILIASAVLGFFLLGTMVGLYVLVLRMFPPHVGATGTGFAIGMGRIGAMVGPALGGVLIAAGWQRPLTWAVLGLPILAAALLALAAGRRTHGAELPS